MPIWMLRRGQPETTPAPSQAPATAAPIIAMSVRTSTLTMAMKMKACASVGSVWPTLSVPGMRSSRTRPRELEDRRGRGERADAERVEEVGDEADREPERRRARRVLSRRTRGASPRGGAGERHQVGDRYQSQADEQGGLHGGRVYSPLQSPMSQDESQGRTPKLRSETTTSGRGLLRRLMDGLRGAAPSPAGDPERIGRYRILHKLGQGGMGVVYAAEDPSLGRRVALKTIAQADDTAASASGVRPAPRPASATQCLPDLRDRRGRGRLFIAMELLDGEPLSERLERGPLTLAETCSLGREMLAALDALHAQGVIHRDVKPSNVFLTPAARSSWTSAWRGRFRATRGEPSSWQRPHAVRPDRGHAALHGAGAGARATRSTRAPTSSRRAPCCSRRSRGGRASRARRPWR